MPDLRATSTTTPHSRPTLNDVLDLFECYAATDGKLAAELDRIGVEASSARRVSSAAVIELLVLLDASLVSAVPATSELDAPPTTPGPAGVARCEQRVVERTQPHPFGGTV